MPNTLQAMNPRKMAGKHKKQMPKEMSKHVDTKKQKVKKVKKAKKSKKRNPKKY